MASVSQHSYHPNPDRTTRQVGDAQVSVFYETSGDPNSGIRKSTIESNGFRITVKGSISDEQAQQIQNLAFYKNFYWIDTREIFKKIQHAFIDAQAMISYLTEENQITSKEREVMRRIVHMEYVKKIRLFEEAMQSIYIPK